MTPTKPKVIRESLREYNTYRPSVSDPTTRIFTSILNRMAKPVAKIEAVKEVTKQ
jgi:hypothetical protein